MKFYLSMFCFIILKTNVESVILDIKPGTTIQPGTPSLTIRCQSSTDDVASIYNLDIFRRRAGDRTDKDIGTLQVGKSPELENGFESSKYTVTENPSNINMYITPQNSEYDINTTILMACNGNVGNPRKTWQWQTRRFPASTQWIRLTDGVEDGDVTPPTGASCSYRQKTVLTYTATSQDDGLQIRCILDNSEEFAWNYTINLKAPPVTSSMSTSPTTSVNPSENLTQLSAVTVLGVFVAILLVYGVVISLIAVYLYRKLKRDNNQYLTPTVVNQ